MKTFHPILTIIVPGVVHILYAQKDIGGIGSRHLSSILSLLGVFRSRQHKILPDTGGKPFNTRQRVKSHRMRQAMGNALPLMITTQLHATRCRVL